MSDVAEQLHAGRYFDGESAGAQTVRLRFDRDELHILAEDDQLVATWPYAAIRIVDRGVPTAARRFARVGTPERLADLPGETASLLAGCCPALTKSAYTGPSPRLIAGFLGAAVASVVFLFYVAIPLAAREARYWVPPRVETALGDRTASMIEAILGHFGTGGGHSLECRNPQGLLALKQLMTPLVAVSTLSVAPRVDVLNVPEINAVALPGGRILVFRGLIDFTDDPNELAGVLGHEMAHIEYGHPMEIAIRDGAGAFLVGLLVGDVYGGSATAVVGKMMITAQFGREAERLADARGVAILRAAGMDARPLGKFFKKMEVEQSGLSSVPMFLLDHPPSAERAKLIEALPPGGKEILTPAQWTNLRNICK